MNKRTQMWQASSTDIAKRKCTDHHNSGTQETNKQTIASCLNEKQVFPFIFIVTYTWI